MTTDKFEEVDCISFRGERGLDDSNVEKGIFWEAFSRVLALKEFSKVFKFFENAVLFFPSDGLLFAIRRINDDYPCVLTIIHLVENVQRPFTPYDSKIEHAFRVARERETEIEQALRTVVAVNDRVDGIVKRQVAASEAGNPASSVGPQGAPFGLRLHDAFGGKRL